MKNKITINQNYKSLFHHIIKYKYLFLFVCIVLLGLYLRFYNIEKYFAFGWDQGRDAWLVRDILQGKLVLEGPRTGIGHFHLGPLYYYLLAPFYAAAKLDPMASNYFNILANIVNFAVIYIVVKKLFSNREAIFAILLYAGNVYIIKQNQIPWNVSLVPAVSFLCVYVMYKICTGNYRYFMAIATLAGIFFQLHFTAVFLAISVPPLILFCPNKKKALLWAIISIPFLLVWFVPIIIFNYLRSYNEYYKYVDFFKYEFVGFHLRFLLHQLPDILIMFEFVINILLTKYLKFILPLLFFLLIFFNEKNKKMRLLGKIIFCWMLGPVIGFSLYGGPLSDYYFLITLPAVFIVIIYLQNRLIRLGKLPIIIILIFFWTFYFYKNTANLWVKPNENTGLFQQKISVKEAVRNGNKIGYIEGDINAYLYSIWTEK